MRRRRLRLEGFDYVTPGAYFVTVCTHRRAPLLATSAHVDCVSRCWHEIPTHVDVDVFAVLPDHMHGLLILGVGAGHARPLHVIIGSFKSASTRAISRARRTPGAPVWQRGYFDRVVRNEAELAALREYVVNNRDAWNADSGKHISAAALPSAPWLTDPRVWRE